MAQEPVDGNHIEAPAREDAHVLQARLVQKPARASRKRDQVTAVDSYSKTAGEVELLDHVDRMLGPGDGVVRVDQKRRAAGKILCECTKGFLLAGKGLYIGMSHGARRDKTVTPGGFDIARAGKPDHRGEAGDHHTHLESPGPAKREKHHDAAARR